MPLQLATSAYRVTLEWADRRKDLLRSCAEALSLASPAPKPHQACCTPHYHEAALSLADQLDNVADSKSAGKIAQNAGKILGVDICLQSTAILTTLCLDSEYIGNQI